MRERAAQALELGRKLFGDGSLEMLGKPFPQQSQWMANLMRLIEEDQHGPAMLDLCGDELLPILQRCQVEYAAMVDCRSGAESGSRTDLRSLRVKLGRSIVRYSTLTLTLIRRTRQRRSGRSRPPCCRWSCYETAAPLPSWAASRARNEGEDAPSDDALLDQLNNATLEQDAVQQP